MKAPSRGNDDITVGVGAAVGRVERPSGIDAAACIAARR